MASMPDAPEGAALKGRMTKCSLRKCAADVVIKPHRFFGSNSVDRCIMMLFSSNLYYIVYMFQYNTKIIVFLYIVILS